MKIEEEGKTLSKLVIPYLFLMEEYQQQIDKLVKSLLINVEIELKLNSSENQNMRQKLYNIYKLIEYQGLPSKEMFDHNKYFVRKFFLITRNC